MYYIMSCMLCIYYVLHDIFIKIIKETHTYIGSKIDNST